MTSFERERKREPVFSYTNHLVARSNNEFTENKSVLEMCCRQTWIFAHVKFKLNMIKCLREQSDRTGQERQQFCPSPTEEKNMNTEGMGKRLSS
jgi:hypothetical protein